MIKAVIFDMDGLLIDSEPFWRQAHKEVLEARGHRVTDEDLYSMAGKGTTTVLNEWAEKYSWDSHDNEAIEQAIDADVLRQVRANGAALPGVQVLVEELQKHKIPMAIASSSSTELIHTVVNRLDIGNAISIIHSAKHEERGKPFPDVFLSTAKSLGIAAVDCLVFEDSLTGVRAAKAAGMKCIAVPEHPYDHATFEALHPERIVQSLEEIDWEDIVAL